MSDIEWLRLISVPGVCLALTSTWFTVLPIARANGSRPILWALVVVSLLNGLWAIGAMDLSFNLKEINSTGRAYLWVWYARIFPSLAAGVLIWLGLWMRRKQQ